VCTNAEFVEGAKPDRLLVPWLTWLLHPWFIPAVVAFGLLIRFLVAVLLPVEPFSDTAWYLDRATELASGLGYAEDGIRTAYWPVGWPAILAAGLLLTGSMSITVIGINLTGATAIMLLTLWFGRRLAGSEVAARIALLCYALYQNHIAYIGNAATETVYTALLLGAFAMLIANRQGRWLVLISGVLFGIATLIKPQTLLFPFGAVIALALVYRAVTWRQILRCWVLVYLGLLMVVLPWSFRNLHVFGQFVLVSTNGGTALFLGANDDMTGDHYESQDFPSFQALGIPWSERVKRQVELDVKQKQAARRWIAENPGKYLAWMPTKAILLWIKDTDGFWTFDNSYPGHGAAIRLWQIINQILYVGVLVLALPCAFAALRALLRRQEQKAQLALLFCVPVFLTFLAAVFTGQIRYHFPAMPFLFLAAAWTVIVLITHFGPDSARRIEAV
jgi:4-amino-4-deoxy-L-arabinose transferase-like glycosyltransferase